MFGKQVDKKHNRFKTRELKNSIIGKKNCGRALPPFPSNAATMNNGGVCNSILFPLGLLVYQISEYECHLRVSDRHRQDPVSAVCHAGQGGGPPSQAAGRVLGGRGGSHRDGSGRPVGCEIHW